MGRPCQMARLTDGMFSVKPTNQIECERNYYAGSTTDLRCVSMSIYLHQTFMFFVPEWHRVPSYDQLSNLLSTGHHDIANLSLLSSQSRPSSSKPGSSSRSHSRARLSEAAPDITNLPTPFFNKTNPMQFLDIMKGVSARIDENAGVRPRKEFSLGAASSSSRSRKRTRGLSFGGTSELQAGKSTRGIFKKGRVDELRTSGTLTRDEGKGKGRAMSDDEGLDSEVRGRGLQACSSLPDIHFRSDLKRSLSSKDVSFMDVNDKADDIDAEHISRSVVSSSSNLGHGYPDAPFARTFNQAEMPPPPFPYDSSTRKQRQTAADPPRQQSNAAPTPTPLAVSRHSNSINKPQTSSPPPQPPTNYSIKQRKPDAIPKLHPLLYHKLATTKVSPPSIATSTPQTQPQLQPQPKHLSTPIPVSEVVNLKPTPSPFTPLLSNTPPSRPPPLGMRRNRTFPSRTSSSSSSSVQQSSSLTGSGCNLPQRQRGFKPPLLSLSQPQAETQPRTHDLSRVKANTNAIVVEPGSTIGTSKKVSSQNSPEASCTTTNTKMALRSSTSSSESFQSTPPATSSAPSCSHSHSSDASDCSRLNKCHHELTERVTPEPPEGDTDSSFGDLSFDMDALEETMRMYD